MQAGVFAPHLPTKWASLLRQNKYPCQVPTPMMTLKRRSKTKKGEGKYWLTVEHWTPPPHHHRHCQSSRFSICSFRVWSAVLQHQLYSHFSSIGITWYWTSLNDEKFTVKNSLLLVGFLWPLQILCFLVPQFEWLHNPETKQGVHYSNWTGLRFIHTFFLLAKYVQLRKGRHFWVLVKPMLNLSHYYKY